MYGDGAFETIRIHRSAPFRLDDHLERLQQSCEILGMEPRWSAEALRDAVRDLVDANAIDEGLIRITVTVGDADKTSGIIAITSRSLPEIPASPSLHVATTARRMSGPLSQCKSISRVAESVALREAQAEGAFDAILLNEKGRVAESTARNVFAVIGGVLETPPLFDGAFPGVTRAVVFEAAPSVGIKVREASITVDALRGAEEVFLTGSGVGILGVATIDGHRYRAPGPLTQDLGKAYASALEAGSTWEHAENGPDSAS